MIQVWESMFIHQTANTFFTRISHFFYVHYNILDLEFLIKLYLKELFNLYVMIPLHYSPTGDIHVSHAGWPA